MRTHRDDPLLAAQDSQMTAVDGQFDSGMKGKASDSRSTALVRLLTRR